MASLDMINKFKKNTIKLKNKIEMIAYIVFTSSLIYYSFIKKSKAANNENNK